MITKKVCNFLIKIKNDDRGIVAIVVALLLTVIIAFLGLTVDVGYAFMVRTQMQAATDFAALGGAISRDNGESIVAAKAVSTDLADQNGFQDGIDSNVVVVSIPPGRRSSGSLPSSPSPTYGEDDNYVRVTLSKDVPLYFAPLIGIAKTWKIQTNALAGPRNTADCFVAYDNIKNNGLSASKLLNCSVVFGSGGLKSMGNSGGFDITNGDYLAYENGLLDCKSNCINGGNVITNANSKSGSMPSPPIASLPTGLSAQTGCPGNICQPGIYNSDLILRNGTYTFRPGNYLFNAELNTNTNTKIIGDNVFFYFNSNRDITFRGDISLTAPTPSGCNVGSGIAIYSPNSITVNLSTNSPSAAAITGIISLPTGSFTTSGGSMLNLSGSIVADNITFNGGVASQASSNSCNNFMSKNKISLFE